MSEPKLTAALIPVPQGRRRYQKGRESPVRKICRPLWRPLHRHPCAAQERPCADPRVLEDSLVTTLRHVSGETISSTSKLIVTAGRNELHSWGASVTYTRRYQICSILGIVADMDMDGAMLEESTKSDLAKPTPKKTVAKKKAAPAPEPTPAPTAAPQSVDQPLMKEEVDILLNCLIDLRRENVSKFDTIQKKFVEHFQIPSDCRFSESITTQAHQQFLNELL